MTVSFPGVTDRQTLLLWELALAQSIVWCPSFDGLLLFDDDAITTLLTALEDNYQEHGLKP